jgi:hypothetical protein
VSNGATDPKVIRKWQRALYSSHAGAQAVAVIFKCLAVAILAAGAVAAANYYDSIQHDSSLSSGDKTAILIGIAAMTVILASWSAFFGFVLSLLVDIETDTREASLLARRDDVPMPPSRRTGLPSARFQ